jgi:hypothetical protein
MLGGSESTVGAKISSFAANPSDAGRLEAFLQDLASAAEHQTLSFQCSIRKQRRGRSTEEDSESTSTEAALYGIRLPPGAIFQSGRRSAVTSASRSGRLFIGIKAHDTIEASNQALAPTGSDVPPLFDGTKLMEAKMRQQAEESSNVSDEDAVSSGIGDFGTMHAARRGPKSVSSGISSLAYTQSAASFGPKHLAGRSIAHAGTQAHVSSSSTCTQTERPRPPALPQGSGATQEEIEAFSNRHIRLGQRLARRRKKEIRSPSSPPVLVTVNAPLPKGQHVIFEFD